MTPGEGIASPEQLRRLRRELQLGDELLEEVLSGLVKERRRLALALVVGTLVGVILGVVAGAALALWVVR